MDDNDLWSEFCVSCNTAVSSQKLYGPQMIVVRKEGDSSLRLMCDGVFDWNIFRQKAGDLLEDRQGVNHFQLCASPTTCFNTPEAMYWWEGGSWKYVAESEIYPLIIVCFLSALLWCSTYMSMYLNILLSGRRFRWNEIALLCSWGNAFYITMNRLLLKFGYLKQASHLTFHYLLDSFVNPII